MFKQNKWHAIAASVVILLPALFGAIVWHKLPARMPIHWGPDGQIDGYASPLWAVVGMPLLLLGMQWLCILLTTLDRRRTEQSPKVLRTVLWIIPVISIVMNGAIYAAALGASFSIGTVIGLLCGVGFIVIGNLLPKCRQSRTVGIKLKWTLEDESNWNATHRFAGRLWVIGGVALLPTAFLPDSVFMYVLFATVLTMVAVPTVYSYLYYRKHK